MWPWLNQQPPQRSPLTAHELMLERLRMGVPPELATRAAGVRWEDVKNEPGVDQALAEGEILLFERARDSGVTGVVRAAMRYETKSWKPQAETSSGASLEELLRD